jgi:lactate dehydrogenase-like 2-hydroxyacid dehydrogenase
LSDAKPKVLHVGALVPPCATRYLAAFDVVEMAAGAAVPEDAREVRALIAAAPIPAELIAALPRLGLIAAFGTGVEKIDRAAARARGILVANAPDPTVGCVADMAMALLLAAGRGIVAGDAFVRAGAWPGSGFPLMPRMSGRRMGILGLGRIGQAIAQRAAGFGMPVGYHSRRPVTGVPHAWFANVAVLAEWAEVLVVACPGGAATRNLVDAAVLRALGPAGIVVNIARGSVIDEAALIAALEAGTIAGAGLDVFVAEPEVPARLRACRNAVMMPHRGGGTIETWAETADDTIANIRAFLRGERPPGLIEG